MFYVYTLTDPRDGSVFYVGKGVGGRMYEHTRDARSGRVCNKRKTQIILDLLAAGKEPIAKPIAHFDDEQDALDHEADLIASMSGLTNMMPGGGRISQREAKRRYKARLERIAGKRLERNMAWLADWLKRVEAWPDVVFPNMNGGAEKAREFVAAVRSLVGASDLKVGQIAHAGSEGR